MTDHVRPALAFMGFELKLFFREFIPIFFNLVIPVGAYAGAGLSHLPEGAAAMNRFFDESTPAFIVVLTISVALLTVANGLVIYRELGVFKRLMATPLDPAVFVLSGVIRGLFVISVAFAFMMIAALLLTGRLPVFSWIGFILSETVAACGLFAAAYVLGTFFKQQKTIFAASVVIFYGLWFLSGAVAMPTAIPALTWIERVSPSYYVLQFVKLGWGGKLLSLDAVLPFAVLLATGGLSVFFARKRLSWIV